MHGHKIINQNALHYLYSCRMDGLIVDDEF